MLRNWYAVYTKPQKEKRVSSILTKKGIENYCPVISTKGARPYNKKNQFEPLFNSYVFICMNEADIASLNYISGIVSILYWKSKPAKINQDEIDIVKQLTTNYINIRVEKSAVDVNGLIEIMEEPVIAYNENTVSIKYKSVKINLPSLGYIMIADRIKQKEKTVYSEPGLFASFPKRINALFFN